MTEPRLVCPLCHAEVASPESGSPHAAGSEPDREMTTCPDCGALLVRQVHPAHAPWQAPETSGG
jgi:hypothetical protein